MRKNLFKTSIAAALTMALAASTLGCSVPSTQASSSNPNNASESKAQSTTEGSADSTLDLEFSKRDMDPSYDESTATKITLQGSSAQIDGSGATAEAGRLTLSADGTYIISGTWDDGQIVVESGDEDKLQLVFDGLSLHNETGPALYVSNADKCFITLAEGSVNKLSDGSSYQLDGEDDNRDATIFSRDDLTINGAGSLEIVGNYDHAVVSKDDLVITGGDITVTSMQDAFQGKDAIKIGGGNLIVNAGDDAFHSEYLFYAKDGSIDVQSCVEGYEAEKVIVDGGDHKVIASDDALNAAVADSDETTTSETATNGADNGDGTDPTNTQGAGQPPTENPNTQDLSAQGTPPALPDQDGAPSDMGKGFKGDMQIDNGEGTSRGMGSGPRDMQGQPPDGNENRAAQEEPTEQAPGEGGMRGGFGGNGGLGGMDGQMPETSSDCLIQINGGSLYLVAQNDAIDSNGNVELNGGTVLACGPSSGMDGCLDFDLSAQINGGVILMLGSVGSTKGMDQSSQAWKVLQERGNTGQIVTLVDTNGTPLAQIEAPMSFSSVLVSAPDVEESALSVTISQ